MQVVEVILAIHDPGIALAQIVIGQRCDLIKRVQSTLYKQTLSVQVCLDIFTPHDVLHGPILKLNIILHRSL